MAVGSELWDWVPHPGAIFSVALRSNRVPGRVLVGGLGSQQRPQEMLLGQKVPLSQLLADSSSEIFPARYSHLETCCVMQKCLNLGYRPLAASPPPPGPALYKLRSPSQNFSLQKSFGSGTTMPELGV